MAEISYESFLYNGKIISIDVIEEYAKSHNGSIGKYQDKIYCPECGRASLVFTNASENKSRRAYLSAKSVQDHIKGCPYMYPPLSKKETIEHYKKYSISQLKDKMNSIMRSLFSEKPKKSNVQKAQVGGSIKDHPLVVSDTKNKKSKALRRKSLNRKFDKYDDSMIGDTFAFYAKDTKLKAVKHFKNNEGYYLLEIETEQTQIEVYKFINKDDVKEGRLYNIVCIGFLNEFHKIQLVDDYQEAIKYSVSD